MSPYKERHDIDSSSIGFDNLKQNLGLKTCKLKKKSVIEK